MSRCDFRIERLRGASRRPSRSRSDERSTPSAGVHDSLPVERAVHESLSDQHSRAQLGAGRQFAMDDVSTLFYGQLSHLAKSLTSAFQCSDLLSDVIFLRIHLAESSVDFRGFAGFLYVRRVGCRRFLRDRTVVAGDTVGRQCFSLCQT